MRGLIDNSRAIAKLIRLRKDWEDELAKLEDFDSKYIKGLNTSIDALVLSAEDLKN